MLEHIRRTVGISYPKPKTLTEQDYGDDMISDKVDLEFTLFIPFANEDDDYGLELNCRHSYPAQEAKLRAQSFLQPLTSWEAWETALSPYEFQLEMTFYKDAAYRMMLTQNPQLPLTWQNMSDFLKGKSPLPKLHEAGRDLSLKGLDEYQPLCYLYQTDNEIPLFGTAIITYGLNDMSYFNPMRPPEHNQMLADALIGEIKELLSTQARISGINGKSYPISQIVSNIEDFGFERSFIFTFKIGD